VVTVAAVDAEWVRIVSGSHRFAVDVRVLDVAGSALPCPPLPVDELDVSAELSPAGWWSASLSVPLFGPDGHDWRPSKVDDPLTPWGNRLRISLTVEDDNGRTASRLIATVLISDVDVDRPAGLIRVSCVDVAAELAQYKLPFDHPGPLAQDRSPRNIASGIVAQARVRGGLADPDDLLLSDTPWKWGGAGRVFQAGVSGLDAVQDIARLGSAANMIAADRSGRLRAVQVSPGAPRLTVADGEGGQLVSWRERLTRNGAVNGVIVHVDDTEVDDAVVPENPQVPGAVVGTPEGPVPPSMEQALKDALLRKVLQALWVARAQLGTGETNGTNKYLQAYGVPAGADWCDVFVTWVLDQVGAKVPRGYTTWASVLFYVDNAYRRMSQLGQMRKTDPKPMDVIIFGWQHMGFIEDGSTWRQGYVTTIEGNNGEMVRRGRASVAECRGWFTPNWIGL
jgi:hypothetical protein